MSIIRSVLPDKINNPLWFVIGRTMSNFKYFYDSSPLNINRVFDADEVYPGIYVGDLSSSLNKYALKEQGIKNILSVLNGCMENYPDDFKYHIVHVNDDDWVTMSNYFDECIEFINNSIMKREKILVHCNRGMSRSVTMVLAYLMRIHNMSLDTALNIVQSKRSIANPNGGFRNQLLDYARNN